MINNQEINAIKCYVRKNDMIDLQYPVLANRLLPIKGPVLSKPTNKTSEYQNYIEICLTMKSYTKIKSMLFMTTTKPEFSRELFDWK